MSQEHPITPPPELVKHWLGDYFGCAVSGELSESELYLATQAARWGADQELEALLDLADEFLTFETLYDIRAARRPKPPSLKKQALDALDYLLELEVNGERYDIIRRALESLPEEQ